MPQQRQPNLETAKLTLQDMNQFILVPIVQERLKEIAQIYEVSGNEISLRQLTNQPMPSSKNILYLA